MEGTSSPVVALQQGETSPSCWNGDSPALGHRRKAAVGGFKSDHQTAGELPELSPGLEGLPSTIICISRTLPAWTGAGWVTLLTLPQHIVGTDGNKVNYIVYAAPAHC